MIIQQTADRQRIASLIGAAVLALSGCGLSQLAGGVAAAGGGGAVTQEWVDSQPRPPKQIVYRFDDHRYIENDPTGGYVGGCPGEMYYVDEKLGTRTRYGYNKYRNPTGLFKVDSPYVVVRTDSSVQISFDQGRTFHVLPGPDVTGSVDVAVKGNRIYTGIDGFRAYNHQFQILDNQVVSNRTVMPQGQKDGLSVQSPSKQERFTCNDKLPWRPSVSAEKRKATAGGAIK